MQRLDTQDDAKLLTEFAAKGSHAAFAVLVNRHGPMAHGIAMRVLSSHHDAQDVTQAVFILLARDAKKLASSPSVVGWIHTVTRRLALNAYKSRGRRARREHTAMEHATTTTTTTPLNSAQEASCRRELDAAIAQLPERYRQPLLLVHLEGAPMEEVAKRLSLQPETLRMRLSRARGKLRELLGRRGVEIASVTVLSSFLTNELQASSAFSPQLASTILNGAIGVASASPHVLALTAKGAVSTSISLSAITLLMKTKATIIAIIVTLLAIGGGTLHLSKRADSTTAAAMPALGSLTSSQSRNARESSAKDPLAELPYTAFDRLLMQISMLDDDERLTRLRKDLGMNISDKVYRKAIAAYGYQIDAHALFEKLMKQWNSEDPRAATLWLKRIEKFNWFEINGSLAAWLIKDKAAATAWAEKNTDASRLIDSLEEAESIKRNPTPSSSAEFTRRLGDMSKSLEAITGSDKTALNAREEQQSEMRSLVTDWSEQDPAAAMKFFAENQEKFGDRESTETLEFMIKRWAQLDPDAALQWAKETEDEKLRTKSLLSILPSWQLKYPDKSISDATDLSGLPDNDYDILIKAVVENWATVNPTAAMKFAMSAKESTRQRIMVASVISTWSVKAPVEARQWIADAPAGELRDSAILAYTHTDLVTDFEATEKLVREIGDPQIREHAINHFVFFTDAIAKDLPKTLKLARELSNCITPRLVSLAGEINPGDLPAYRTWLDQAAAEGRIMYDGTKSFDVYEPAVADQKRREYEAAQHKELLRDIEEKVYQK